MKKPGLFAEPRVAVAHEDLVALVLLVGVVLDEVVEAPHVARVVVALAAAADCVPDLDGVDLGVVCLLAGEDYLRAVVSGTVAVVRDVGHVGFHHSVGVDGVPAVEDHGDGEGLVAECHEAALLAIVEDGGGENLLAGATSIKILLGCNQIKRRGALRDVLAPLDFLGETLEHVQRLVVVLTVPLVERRLPVLGQRVIEPLPSLFHVGTTSIFPALDEEHLHVVVGERVGGRDDTLFLVPPHESFEEAAELSSVQIF